MMSKEWASFEDLVARILRAKGFTTQVTQPTSDGGVDVIAQREEPLLRGKYVVQCKNWRNPVGVGAVRDLYGVVTHERASKGILITTSSFTQAAVEFANGKPLELIDGEQWNELLREASPCQPPVGAEAAQPRMAEGVEHLVHTFDNLGAWVRREMRELDDLHEKEPIVSAEYILESDTSYPYWIEYHDAASSSVTSFRDCMHDIGEVVKRLNEAISQWGLLSDFATQTDAQEELDHCVSRYQHLVEKACHIYTGLRKMAAPRPSLTAWHRGALEGMYYGLSAVLSRLIQSPRKTYEGKRVTIEVEAPQELYDYYVERYGDLITTASDALEQAMADEILCKCPQCGALAQTQRFCTKCATELRGQSIGRG